MQSPAPDQLPRPRRVPAKANGLKPIDTDISYLFRQPSFREAEVNNCARLLHKGL